MRFAGPLCRRRGPAGFSLIELMVVITIIALLAGGVSIYLFGFRGEAETTRVRSDFKAIEDALQLYRLKMHKYPESLEELTTPLPGHSEPLLKKLPKDPWGNTYLYRKVEKGVEIYTLGADNADGGEGSDKDLSSLDEDEEDLEGQ